MNLDNSIKSFRQIIHRDKFRKPSSELFPDLIKWTIKNKGATYYFFLLGLHKKGHYMQDYIDDHDYSKIHDQLDPEYYRPMLEDKVIFDRYIKSFNIPSPEMIGIIEQGKIYWEKDNRFEPLKSILNTPMEAFCKEVTSWGGKNIYKVVIRNRKLLINNKPMSFKAFSDVLGQGKFILQRKIEQHRKLNMLNPCCVNTLRIYTIRDGNKPKYFKSFLRMGVGGSVVDNVSSNNLAIGIEDDHYLAQKAYRRSNPPIWLSHHPDTQVEFSSFKIPDHKEAIRLCTDTHKYFSDFLIIAWDVAISKSGPLLLEGNPAPSLTFIQVLYGGLKEEFVSAAKAYRKTKLMA